MDFSIKRPKSTPPDSSNLINKPLPDKSTTVTPAAIQPPPDSKGKTPPDKVPPHKRLKWIFFKPEHVSRKKWLLVNGLLLLAVMLTFFVARALYRHFTYVPPIQNVVVEEKKPTTEPSRLTGLPVNPGLNLRPVTGVIIENSPDARPQSGLTDAGVIVEAIAEGGITRFLALYQDTKPKTIGPIRSARPYFLDFVMAFDSSLAHVGGSPQAISQIRHLKLRDLDQFYNAGAYTRVSRRYAPHNVYSSTSKLDALNKSKGFMSSKFTSLARKAENASKKPTATSINMTISGYYYNTHYDYDIKTNSYKRSMGGTKHVDEISKKQISPKVLVALVMPYSIHSDGQHSVYGTTGSGRAFIFQDGIVVKGTWYKPKRSSQVTFKDASGKAVALNPGQTWITLMGSASDIKYRNSLSKN